MKLTIDNLDGRGAIDYSGALDRSNGSAPATVKRTLNAPSTFTATLCLEGTQLAVPARRGRVAVLAENGTTLFTGYLTVEPLSVYAGVASAGPVYRLSLRAVSDEWLLDKAGAGLTAGTAYGVAGSTVFNALVKRAGLGQFVTAAVPVGARAVGVFAPAAGASATAAWSTHAGNVAGTTYGAYRVLDGAVTLEQVPGAPHALSEGDGTLQLGALQLATVRELTNDVTVSGGMEATTYWQEIFVGDGTTETFLLTGEPAAMTGGAALLLLDDFGGEAINSATWAVTDPGSHLALGADGLALSGGNGLDGQTTLAAQDALEVAGTVVFELGSVRLDAGSAGVLAGLYNGAVAQSNCMAGFNVRQAGGQTLMVALVEGAEVGTSFPLLQGHSYTLRLRVHCAEMQRVRQVFYGRSGSGAVAQFGGGLVDAPARLVLEARDLGDASSAAVTVLYDGALPVAPAVVQVAAVNSLQLFGSVGSARLTRTGSAWVQTTGGNTGTVRTDLVGEPNEGVDCKISASVTGSVTFFDGRVPAVGDHINVAYRGRARAVGRLADAASVAAEAAGGGAGTARWLGRVVQPAARDSEDCENAALAIVSAGSNRAAATAGSYAATFAQCGPQAGPPGGDIWPGDTLELTANGSSVSVIVRAVEVTDHGAAPETLGYRVAFANDWAEELGLRLSEAIAADAVLPAEALNLVPGPAAGDIATVPMHVLANLQNMTVAAVSTGAVQVDAGLDAPAGGGFEVRRRDGGFGSGLGNATTGASSADLVLRTPVRGFSIPRGAFEEQFFVRMYDGSTPTLYSRFSAAIVTHVPVA